MTKQMRFGEALGVICEKRVICEMPEAMQDICDKLRAPGEIIQRRGDGVQYEALCQAFKELDSLLKQYRELVAKNLEKECEKLRNGLLFNHGCANYQLGIGNLNYAKAVKDFEELLELNPNNHQLLYAVGTELVHIGADKAIPALERAVKLGPKSCNNCDCRLAFDYKLALRDAIQKKWDDYEKKREAGMDRMRDGPWMTRNRRYGGPIC